GIAERDSHASLARSSRLNKQRLPLLLVEPLNDFLDGFELIEPIDDFTARGDFRPWLTLSDLEPPILQAVLRVEAINFAGRFISGLVPEPHVVPVRVVDERSDAELLLQPIGVKLGLSSAGLCIDRRLLGLDDGQ